MACPSEMFTPSHPAVSLVSGGRTAPAISSLCWPIRFRADGSEEARTWCAPRWSTGAFFVTGFSTHKMPGHFERHSPEWGAIPAICRSHRGTRSEEHTSELQSHSDLVCRLLLEKKKSTTYV